MRRTRAFSAIPPIVWAATSFLFALLVLYATTMPTFQGSDEPLHLDMVHAVRSGSYPEFDERFVSDQIYDTLARTKYRDEAPRFRADEATPRGQRPPFDRLAKDRPSILQNQLPQHPPLYYGLLAIPSAAVRSLSFDAEVVLLRILSAALLLPVPVLCYLTARRLGAAQAAASAAAVAVTVIPDVLVTSVLLNNDSLLRLLFSVAILLLARVWTGDASRKTALLIGVITGAALLTKGFALVLYPCIALSYLVAFKRGASRAETAVRAISAGALATAIGGWWWIRNVLLFGRVQTGAKQHSKAPSSFHPDYDYWLARFARALTQSSVLYASRLVVIAVLIGVVLIAVGAVPGLRQWSKHALTNLAMLVLPVVLVVGLLLFQGFFSYRRTGLIGGVNSRYLYVGVVAFAVVAAAAAARVLRRPAAVIAGLAVTLNGVQLHVFFRNYWSSMTALTAWYPFNPIVLAGLALVTAVGATVTLRWAWREH